MLILYDSKSIQYYSLKMNFASIKLTFTLENSD